MTEFLKDPVFVVGEIDENIDLSLPPTSGEEYIKRVVIEAQQCADVVVADINHIRIHKPTIDVSSSLAGCIEAPACLGPTLDWQQCQIADFSDIRLYLSQLKSEIQAQKREWKPPKINFPDVDNQQLWMDFCLGLHNNTPSNSPTLNIVFCLNQPTIEQVLEYLVQYVEAEGKMSYEVGQWIYALLAVLEVPLNPDTCSCLRSLARTCSIIRANSSKLELHEVGSINLFICLVARYFRQLDLADP